MENGNWKLGRKRKDNAETRRAQHSRREKSKSAGNEASATLKNEEKRSLPPFLRQGERSAGPTKGRKIGRVEMNGLLGMIALQQHVVIVEWQRGLIGWLIIGLLAGWLAGKMARGHGFGCIGDILIGLIGSVIGGWIFTQLGIGHANTFLFSLAAATVGAVLLVSIAHLFFGGKS
jgi:uncharacterized membrane protein YeaQ/YmgE (transglycosylase-associated protein family)